MPVVAFAPPRDQVLVDTNDERVFELAEKLWERGAARDPAGAISIRVAVRPGPAPASLAEKRIVWDHAPDLYTVSLDGLLSVRIDLVRAAVEAEVSEGLVGATPALAARFVLEAPAAVLLSRRAYTVLHAGAVVGPRGAVVLRGGAGAGKSTLTAAAWQAGFGVLADESLLVAREDPDDLAASVRDLTVRPDAAALLSIEDVTEITFSGGEEKRRVDLFRDSRPPRRRARRVATLLLGPRTPGPARLVLLEKAAFRAAFRDGEIPQERLAGDPDAVAQRWAERDSWRLDGAVDLPGATGILRSILG